jgi:hypothetical protein
MRKFSNAAMAIAFLLVFSVCLPAHASQDPAQSQAQQQPETGQQAQNFPEEKLEAYADAALEVAKINLRLAPQIRQANTDEQKRTLFLEMQEEMVTAVNNTDGITVQEYNQISMAAREDENLAGRIRSKFDDLQQQQTEQNRLN